MLIASSIVNVIPGAEQKISADINLMQGVEVVAQKKGNLVIVLEAENSKQLEQIALQISDLSGVIGVFPVYINMEALALA